mmetsp:Transcript_32248/g.102498  ORF Transcript_32248/g.102498 Transcript_32248/m.102498 type:complete len:90 (-) Transcript_32248:73-342(-)
MVRDARGSWCGLAATARAMSASQAPGVCEGTGAFLTTIRMQPRVLLLIEGVNLDTYDFLLPCISCASCATYGWSPAGRAEHEAPAAGRG